MLVFRYASRVLATIACICSYINPAFSQRENHGSLQIKQDRVVSFNTDEVSYADIDVSPDGKKLAFNLLGEIYVMDAKGGSAKKITNDLSLNFRPTWSPDGNKIACISDYYGTFQLNVIYLNNGLRQVLGAKDGELDINSVPVWHQGSNFVSVGQKTYSLVGGRLSSSMQVPKYQTGVLSPDGQWWAFIADSSDKKCLLLKNINTNITRIIKELIANDDNRIKSGAPNQYFSFSPDSKGIYINYGGKIHRFSVDTGIDQIIPFTAEIKTGLGYFNYNTYKLSQDSIDVRYIRTPIISRDGKKLVFSALSKIYAMDLPAGKPHILVDQSINQFQPALSPDGKWIAFVSWNDTIGGFLWKVSSSGGKPEQITKEPGQYQQPTWSKDGKLIAVVKGSPKLLDRDDPGIGELQLISIDRGLVKIIADTVPLWNKISFSGDGERIFFQPYNTTISSVSPQLVSKKINGTDLQVFAIGDEFKYLQYRIISPDLRYIVYSLDEDLYLLPVCNLMDRQLIYKKTESLSAIRFSKGVDPFWEESGNMLMWVYGNKVYRINPDSIIEAAIKQNIEGKVDSKNDKYISVSIKPYQVIDINITTPANYAHGLIALKNVRVITIYNNKVIDTGTIVIRNGLIISVGASNKIVIPKGAKVLDLAGTTVMPGLIDLHCHMRVPSNIFPQQSWMFLANLAFGVTTARDPSLSFDSFGYKELLESGQMLGPRLITVGRAARIPDGLLQLNSIEDASNLVQKRVIMGGIVAKQYGLQTRLQRQLMLMACRQGKLNMTNEGDRNPIIALGMIKDGSTGIEHSPLWGDVYDDVITFIAKSKTFLTPTLQVGYGSNAAKEYFNYKYWKHPDSKLRRFTFSDSFQTGPRSNGAETYETITSAKYKDTLNPDFIYPSSIMARIRMKGGKIGVGSHGNNEGIGMHNEMWALQMGGMNNYQVLEAATLVGAEALGLQNDLGSIEVGKIADLIILNKNPLDDIHNSREIRYVMKDGILYDGDTLNEIWPEKKKGPTSWR